MVSEHIVVEDNSLLASTSGLPVVGSRTKVSRDATELSDLIFRFDLVQKLEAIKRHNAGSICYV